MKTSNLCDVIKRISFDCGNENEYRFDSDENFYWSADIEKEWKEAQKEIENINYKGKNWEIFGWYDLSGFEYWRIEQKEPNYIAITIKVTKSTLTKKEVEAIKKYLDYALADADIIQEKYKADLREFI